MSAEVNNVYNPNEMEPIIRQNWADEELYRVTEDPEKTGKFVLDMFPYPSGTGLHVGHVRGYIATDVLARRMRLEGYEVLHPMGWDAFGLPAENFALKNKIHPREAVAQNVANFKGQIEELGLTYDWNREINTTDPEYVKHTQSMFIKMFKAGLVYEAKEPINWCPCCATGLANEDVQDGNCERCETPVEQRPLDQWKIRITDYADRLLDGTHSLEWEPELLAMQRNWIGKREGLKVEGEITGTSEAASKVEVITDEPERFLTARALTVAADHPLIAALQDEAVLDEATTTAIEHWKNLSPLERAKFKGDTKELEGLSYENPITKQILPVHIDARLSVAESDGGVGLLDDESEWSAVTALRNLGLYDTMRAIITEDDLTTKYSKEAVHDDVTQYLLGREAAEKITTYKLQDWVFSRQRFWGEPIPLVHCDDCGVNPVDEADLPILLPDVDNYTTSGTGESPLATMPEWYKTTCPCCQGEARRETNTMPQWAGSSWYWHRYKDPHNSETFVSPEAEEYWNEVDICIGGAEHATRHLIYARFWHMFLYDQGLVSTPEPFKAVQHVGLILGPDGRKMSKRFGNVVDPAGVAQEYGADALRMYEMFIGDFSKSTPWQTNGIKGMHRFLSRVWSMQDKIDDSVQSVGTPVASSIEEINEHLNEYRFNSAIAQIMTLTKQISQSDKVNKNDYDALLQMLYPFAPHITDAIWRKRYDGKTIDKSAWPKASDFITENAAENMREIAIQMNGKFVGKIAVSTGELESEEAVLTRALSSHKRLQSAQEANSIKRSVYVPGKVLNIVV